MPSQSRRYSRAKAEAYRARLRAQGLGPVQVWVSDTRWTTFAAEASRQSLAVATSSYAGEDQAFVDTIAECSSA